MSNNIKIYSFSKLTEKILEMYYKDLKYSKDFNNLKDLRLLEALFKKDEDKTKDNYNKKK